MKKIISIILICVLCCTLTVSASAYNYDFSSGTDTLSCFAKPTSSDEPVTSDPMSENVQRNKDAAYLPPPYFYGSGDISTEKSILYHDNGDDLSTSFMTTDTVPLYYSDNSIGTIYVEKTGKTIKIYEGEQLDNLKKGAGHFTSTSTWDGNVGLCGHNRGEYPYFGFVKDLQTSDRIVYTTLYGSRTYEVFNKEQIGEYDYSKLGWTSENILTLITCLQGVSDLRVSVQLREVR